VAWPSKGSGCRDGRGVAGLGLAGRAQHFQGFLPRIMLLSAQPEAICNEGVESLKHKQEALSKKASSVLLRWCNHVKKPKNASPPAKEQALTPTALNSHPRRQRSGRWARSLFLGCPHSVPPGRKPWGQLPPPSRQSSSGSPPLAHPATLPSCSGPPAAQGHQRILWSCHPFAPARSHSQHCWGHSQGEDVVAPPLAEPPWDQALTQAQVLSCEPPL